MSLHSVHLSKITKVRLREVYEAVFFWTSSDTRSACVSKFNIIMVIIAALKVQNCLDESIVSRMVYPEAEHGVRAVVDDNM